MDFPDVFNLPEEQARDVMQAYVAGMMDEKESIVALINDLKTSSKDLVVTAAYAELLTMLSTEPFNGK